MPDSSWRLHRLSEVDSTNLELLRAMGAGGELDRDRTVLLARHQTRGKGRHQRGWYCPPGDGLLLSLRLDLPVSPRLSLLPLACCRVLLDTARMTLPAKALEANPLCWKWPNDLVAWTGSRWGKLAGILVQTQVQGAQCRAVCGFGLNLRQKDFPEDLAPGALSLAQLGWEGSAEALLDALLQQASRLPALLAESSMLLASLEPDHLLSRLPLFMQRADRRLPVAAHRVLPDGRLELELESGRQAFAAGELRLAREEAALVYHERIDS